MAIRHRMKHWHLSIVILGVIVALAVWLYPEPAPDLKDLEEPRPAVGEPGAKPTANDVPSIPFTDVTREAGILFSHHSGATGEKLLPETMGSGVAFLDFDNDSDQDLLFINGKNWPHAQQEEGNSTTPALYQNDGAGNFTDVTAECGLNVICYGTGVAVGDFDNDGWRDVFIAAVGRDLLFRNDSGRFEEVTATAGVGGESDDYSSSCGWFDYDRDGDLDLFVCRYVEWSRQADLAQDFSRTGGVRDYGQPRNFAGTFCALYRNDGMGKFTDVSEEAGLWIRSPSDQPLGKSLGVTFADLDDDGWLDIIVANDTVRNFLFRNEGDGTFEEIGVAAGIAYDNEGAARGGMGVDAARFRNDGNWGITVGNFANEATAFFVSRQPLQFLDDANLVGLAAPTSLDLTFGLFFFDADLDGRLDLFAANGHISEQIERTQTSQRRAQAPRLFWNAGPQAAPEFVALSETQAGDLAQPVVGRGAAYADVDDDGDLDVVITTVNNPPRLLRNDQQSGNHWLRLKLIGDRDNRDAIGSRVVVRAKDQTLIRFGMPTRSYLSQMELPVTFGLGEADAVEDVTITWPDGSETKLDKPPLDTMRIVRQSEETE